MSDLPILTGGLMSCCIETIKQFTGRDDDGVIIGCDECGRSLQVKKQRWRWLPVDTTAPRTFASGLMTGMDPGPKRGGRWTRLRQGDPGGGRR